MFKVLVKPGSLKFRPACELVNVANKIEGWVGSANVLGCSQYLFGSKFARESGRDERSVCQHHHALV